jgi:glycosyltransferase involved in cell wall biosynthesis
MTMAVAVPFEPLSPPDVVIVIESLSGGGAERVCVNLANAWTAWGLNVEFVLLRQERVLASGLAETIRVTSLGVERARQAVLPLGRFLAHRRPSAILAVMPPSTWIAAAARAWVRSPARLVTAEHTDWSAVRLSPPNPDSLSFRLQTRLATRVANARVAVSNGVAEAVARIAGLPRDAVDVIHNPITPLPPDGEVDPAIMTAWCSAPGHKLIAIGALKPAKDFKTLLAAAARLRDTAPFSLLILGEGPLRKDLEDLRSQLGLADCVQMPGFVPNPQAYLRGADLLVLSSTNEGFANVIVESLACGVPVVSTDCRSGPREILEGGRFGDLVPVGDADGLASAVQTALSRTPDRELLVRRSLDFSIDIAADRYVRLLFPEHLPGHAVRERAA